MSEIVADPRHISCCLLFSRPGIEESQSVGPDLSLARARGARGRFEMAPAEAVRIARRARARLHAIRRFARLEGPVRA
jgi:hypothetical protein